MSSQRQIILNNIRWFVADINLDLVITINGEGLEDPQVLERLSQIPINWILDPIHPERIVLLYPITDMTHPIFEAIPTDSVAYNPNSLPTALEVIGAIGTYYNEKISPNQVINDNEIEYNNRYLDLNYNRSSLLQRLTFDGLELIRAGVYLVRLRS